MLLKIFRRFWISFEWESGVLKKIAQTVAGSKREKRWTWFWRAHRNHLLDGTGNLLDLLKVTSVKSNAVCSFGAFLMLYKVWQAAENIIHNKTIALNHLLMRYLNRYLVVFNLNSGVLLRHQKLNVKYHIKCSSDKSH